LFATPPSLRPRSSQATGGRTAGISARQHRVERGTAREQQLLAGDHVDRHHANRDRHLLKQLMLEMVRNQRTQTGLGHETITRAKEAEQTAERPEREDLSAPDRPPDLGQLVGGLGSRGA
jgi:hypothetical protein